MYLCYYPNRIKGANGGNEHVDKGCLHYFNRSWAENEWNLFDLTPMDSPYTDQKGAFFDKLNELYFRTWGKEVGYIEELRLAMNFEPFFVMSTLPFIDDFGVLYNDGYYINRSLLAHEAHIEWASQDTSFLLSHFDCGLIYFRNRKSVQNLIDLMYQTIDSSNDELLKFIKDNASGEDAHGLLTPGVIFKFLHTIHKYKIHEILKEIGFEFNQKEVCLNEDFYLKEDVINKNKIFRLKKRNILHQENLKLTHFGDRRITLHKYLVEEENE